MPGARRPRCRSLAQSNRMVSLSRRPAGGREGGAGRVRTVNRWQPAPRRRAVGRRCVAASRRDARLPNPGCWRQREEGMPSCMRLPPLGHARGCRALVMLRDGIPKAWPEEPNGHPRARRSPADATVDFRRSLRASFRGTRACLGRKAPAAAASAANTLVDRGNDGERFPSASSGQAFGCGLRMTGQ